MTLPSNGNNLSESGLSAASVAPAAWLSPSQLDQQRPGLRKPRLTPGMLTQLKVVGGAVWSPDGKYLYFPQDIDGHSHIYRLEISTGQLLQLSSDIEAGALLTISQKAFDISPDGTRLVYLGGANGKLWLLPAEGGPATPLTSSEGSQSAALFSPDGKWIVFSVANGETQAIAAVASDGQSWPRRVSLLPDAFAFDPQWFPDSQRIVYAEYDSHDLPFAGTRIVVSDLGGGETKILADGWANNIYYQQPHPSPDGKWLAYQSDESGWSNIWLLNLETGAKHPLNPEPHEQNDHTWSPDSRQVAYTSNQDCALQVWVADLNGQAHPVDSTSSVATALTFSPDGQKLCYVRQSPLSPTNLYLIDLQQNALPFQLTNNTIGGLAQAGLVEPETVHWISPDGLEIEGLLYKPVDFEPGKHPALVHIHGGPIAQYHRRWDATVQYLVGRGWVVIEPNFRGSTGYGRSFRRALQGAWGQEDMLDNLGALEYLKKSKLCHPERVVAWGGSGGGYATMLLLSKWPDAFKAGVALVGVSNFVSFPEQTDRFAKYLMHSILGPRADNFKLFEERSPVTYAHQVKAPLQILMGEKDYRVPVAQAEEMVEALKKAGIANYEYHVYEGEGHGWRKQVNILDYISRMEKFLEKWVLER